MTLAAQILAASAFRKEGSCGGSSMNDFARAAASLAGALFGRDQMGGMPTDGGGIMPAEVSR